jgi:hypothetical protein
MAMPPVGGNNLVIAAKSFADTDSNGFFADIAMNYTEYATFMKIV